MIVLQYVQSFFNFGCSILGCISFTVLMTGLYTTHNSCDYSYASCTLYRSIQADTAFSFVLIFLPWLGCLVGLIGSKPGAIIYGILVFALTVCMLICCSIILANGNDVWNEGRDSNQLTSTAPIVSGMLIYNICIAQIVLIWIFLLGGAGTTIFAARKQVNQFQHVYYNKAEIH